MNITKAREELRFAGMLGHRFATLRAKGGIGLQCSDPKSAKDYIAKNGGTAYEKINGKWCNLK